MKHELRMITARSDGFKDENEKAIAYTVISPWEAPMPANDTHFGEPTPDKPTGRPTLKLGRKS